MDAVPITERLNKKYPFIDSVSIYEGISYILNDQMIAVSCIKDILTDIEVAIKLIVEKLKSNNNSRLIYCGAGTSGRIGVQDGVELYPTFGWPLERLEFILAGGKKALLEPIENSEDDIYMAEKEFHLKNIDKSDVVFAISASGNTPFTNKLQELAFNKNALTITICNNPKANLIKFGNVSLILDTREEILAGSTRLKAGTAQKICLNMISTSIMTRLGFVKSGMMSNLLPMNEKLRQRQVEIQKNIND